MLKVHLGEHGDIAFREALLMSPVFVQERVCYGSCIERDAIAESIDFMLSGLIHCQI
jgi:hypothetical protein